MLDPNMAKEKVPGADPDATSDETLHDLEESESQPESGTATSDIAPSPDGSLDEAERGKSEPGA
jgi:hypothetical protein